MLPKEVIKEAGILRRQLQKGLVNVPQVEAFLAKIEADKPAKKSPAGYDFQMENFLRGRARKVKKGQQL